jgi:hypothetical protein
MLYKFMKKSITLVILGLMVIAMLGAVSATGSKTAIAGKIYNADFTGIVEGATVEVTCNGNLAPSVLSKVDGTYSVEYAGEVCNEGDTLSVHAFKTGVGENTVTGNIYDDYPIQELDLNLGVVNVPLVPEFGLIAGLVTVLGAVGVFFFVRKK